ncbi:unnamed protein product [Caenorhabditis bovis]|uniref:ISXO2-like transposase domain-containing protein n=1 Tax=Caenorhabditis bovis TaxID=2654633 RepID=A0A8S1FGD2_9PELO|nr:unnamed protein product [Caenorhabditis bovis]
MNESEDNRGLKRKNDDSNVNLAEEFNSTSTKKTNKVDDQTEKRRNDGLSENMGRKCHEDEERHEIDSSNGIAGSASLQKEETESPHHEDEKVSNWSKKDRQEVAQTDASVSKKLEDEKKISAKNEEKASCSNNIENTSSSSRSEYYETMCKAFGITDSDRERWSAAAASTSSASQRGKAAASRGRFPVRRLQPDTGNNPTILEDGQEVAPLDEVLNIEFTVEKLVELLNDQRNGLNFLARYGIIPNSRVCKTGKCPKGQSMTFGKNTLGYVWRCQRCRRNFGDRAAPRVSVFDGTFLSNSRIPLHKLFSFMFIWSTNPGLSLNVYKQIMGENRISPESMKKTISFMRFVIQMWCERTYANSKIGGDGKHVEIIETFCVESLENLRLVVRTAFVCLEDNTFGYVGVKLENRSLFLRAVNEKVAPGSAIVMKDTYLNRFGDLQTLNEGLAHHYTVSTISDVWLQLDAEERDRQSIKTKMSKAPNADHEPIAYEYFFRRCYGDKCFNHLLWIMRQLQTKPEAETSQPKA